MDGRSIVSKLGNHSPKLLVLFNECIDILEMFFTFCQAELYALIDGHEVKTMVSTSDLSVTEGKVCDQIIVKLVLVVLIVNSMISNIIQLRPIFNRCCINLVLELLLETGKMECCILIDWSMR